MKKFECIDCSAVAENDPCVVVIEETSGSDNVVGHPGHCPFTGLSANWVRVVCD